MKRQKLIFVFILIFFALSGCSKKDRLTVDTFVLNISPDASSVQPGGSVQLTASGSSAVKTNMGVIVSWYVDPAGMGTLSNAAGVSTVFTASSSAYGTVRVIAMYKDFISEAEVGVGVADVITDVYAAGYVGVDFEGGTLELSDDTTYFKEGMKSLKADFNITGGWGCWYVYAGNDDTGADRRDMSAYIGGYLRFWVKTPVDLKIKIEDNSIYEIRLGNCGSYIDNEWHKVAIPISDFSGLDLFAIKSLFTIVVESGSGSFYIDNVRWTIN